MRSAFLFLALLLLAGCDRGEIGAASEFTATFDGDELRTYTGRATFFSTTPVEGAGEIIELRLDPDGDLGQSITIVDPNRQIESTGGYALGNPNQGGIFVPLSFADATLSTDDPTFQAISGTLEITRADGIGLDGTFTARLASGPGTAGQRATLDGAFRAARVAAP